MLDATPTKEEMFVWKYKLTIEVVAHTDNGTYDVEATSNAPPDHEGVMTTLANPTAGGGNMAQNLVVIDDTTFQDAWMKKNLGGTSTSSVVVFYGGDDQKDVDSVVRSIGLKGQDVRAVVVMRFPSAVPTTLPVFVVTNDIVPWMIGTDDATRKIRIAVADQPGMSSNKGSSNHSQRGEFVPCTLSLEVENSRKEKKTAIITPKSMFGPVDATTSTYDLKQLSPWYGPNGMIVEITARGCSLDSPCVLYYDVSRQEAVMSVLEIAARKEAIKAMIVLSEPPTGTILTLPTFVVERSDMKMFSNHPQRAKITIPVIPKEEPSHPTNTSSGRDVGVGSYLHAARIVNGDPHDPETPAGPSNHNTANKRTQNDSPPGDADTHTGASNKKIKSVDSSQNEIGGAAASNKKINSMDSSQDENGWAAATNKNINSMDTSQSENRAEVPSPIKAPSDNGRNDPSDCHRRSGPIPHGSPKNMSYAQAASQPGSKKGSEKGLMKTIKDTVTATVNYMNPFSSESWQDVLNDEAGWEARTSFARYKQSMDRIDKELSVGDESQKQSAVRAVNDFLRRGNYKITHIAFAAKLFRATDVVDLATNVIVGLSKLKPVWAKEVHRCFRDPMNKPHIILHHFFGSAMDHWQSLGPFPFTTRTALLLVLRFWNECGLVRREDVGWKQLRAVASETFTEGDFAGFAGAFGDTRARTIELFLCSNLEQVIITLFRFNERTARYVYLESDVARLIASLVTECSLDDAGAMGDVWAKLFAALEVVGFPRSDDDRCRRRILEALVRHAGYGQRRSFRSLPCLIASCHRSNHHAPILKQLLREELYTTLTTCSPSGHDVLFLLKSDPGRLLATPKGIEAISDSATSTLKKMTSFREKIRFADELCGSLYTTGILKNSRQLITALIAAAVETTTEKQAVFVDAFDLAVELPWIFKSVGRGGLESVVVKVLPDGSGEALLQKPAWVARMLKTEMNHDPGLFYVCLCDRLEAVLCEAASTIEVAAKFCIETHDNCPHSAATIEIASKVFKRSFSRWSPSEIEDIVKLSPCTLHLLSRSFKVYSPSLDGCNKRIVGILKEWYKCFRSNTVTKDCLQKSSAHSLEPSWLFLIENLQFPPEEEIRSKLKELNRLSEKIVSSLSGPEGGTQCLVTILKAYNSLPPSDSPVGKLLLAYRPLLPQNDDQTTSQAADRSIERHLCQMIEDEKVATAFRKQYDEDIRICDYFLTNPSALFRRRMSSFIKGRLQMRALSRALKETLTYIGHLFGPAATFKDVDSAVGTLSTAGIALREELLVLSASKKLDLTEEKKDRFQAVATMSRLSGPLVRFVKFCRQFKFAVVESDNTFKEFETAADRLGSGEVLGLDGEACIEFSTRLCRLLCPKTMSGCSDKDARFEAERRLPYFGLLGAYSLNSEVWSFTREMNWFGEVGLKRFYDEFGNVTNVLLGNAASYEMAVLNSLEPTVRTVSFIGTLRQCQEIESLLDSLVKNSDVEKCSQDETYRDIAQVQTNLSQIRDWFTHGVDEKAAAFSLFEAVNKTGAYCIQQQAKGSLMLTLTYRMDAGSKSLQGDELTNLIQHVGLVQHEDKMVVESVNGLIEQYQLVSRAADNFIEMAKLGFDDATDALDCGVGRDHVSRARELLVLSEDNRRNNEIKLKHLREMHPISMLFSMEELRQIYAIISTGPESESWPDIVRMTRKLLGSNAETDFEEWAKKSAMVVSTIVDDLGEGSGGWLRVASKFVESVYASLDDESLCRSSQRTRKESRITLHTLSFDDSCLHAAVLRLLMFIYKNRLPFEFEVLDPMGGCSDDHLDLFLRRVEVFTSQIFVIINVDRLGGRLLEKLQSFLSRRDQASSGIQLHCVQCGASSILHTGPWVDGRNWDEESMKAAMEKDGKPEQSWRGLLLDGRFVSEVNIVWTPSSGTGKTRFIREKMEEKVTAESGGITIHEKTSTASLVAEFKAKFPTSSEEIVTHVNFCHLPERSDDAKPWLDSINRFFFSLLVLRSVHDPASGQSFCLGERMWTMFVELPASTGDANAWLRKNVPILGIFGTVVAPDTTFSIDSKVRRVCTYLRAFDNGTINRKFSPGRQILFVLDWSVSMHVPIDHRGSTPLGIAADNALQLFESHVQVGDLFGLTMFDDSTTVVIELQRVTDEDHKRELRMRLDQVRDGGGGGTDMYDALMKTLDTRGRVASYADTWIVCLTDGKSSDKSKHQLQLRLQASSDNMRIIVIGVNLNAEVEEEMRLLSGKYRKSESGIFFASTSTLEALNDAFGRVSRCIPVSQTFELFDGKLSDDECRQFLREYTTFISEDDFLTRKFWTGLLYRRVEVFDMNTDFNENVTHELLGSTLMETMLEEVKRFLTTRQSLDWVGENHAQLIYDFADPKDPKFRLVCTSPNELHASVRKKYEDLDLPGFRIPSANELSDRRTLDRFLSQSLGIPLEASPCGQPRLKCIDDNNFILTLDFTMKILSIHERVACQIPCVIEGETGVSKTALTKMYAILRNSCLTAQANAATAEDLELIEEGVIESGCSVGLGDTPLERLQDALATASQKSIGDETELAGAVRRLIQIRCASRPSIFRSIPPEFTDEKDRRTKTAVDLLNWFASSGLEPTFFECNVDASLTEDDIMAKFSEVRIVARKLLGSGALVVVFLDEINTTSIMGLLKEIIVDRSVKGDILEDNVVVISACNPFRTQATTDGSERENDLGKEWASGHYQVVALPASLEKVKWAFGSLSQNQEKDFVYRRMENLADLPISTQRAMTEVVSTSQDLMRRFAYRNIIAGLKRVVRSGAREMRSDDLEANAQNRARSVVSLRDIQRVFFFYEFFFSFSLKEVETPRDSMMLAVAVVYYLRLDVESRAEFKREVENLQLEQGRRSMQSILDAAMETVVASTEIPTGIALTRGLKENVFMTIACVLSRTPLLIVGPPGTSKTLAVNIASDNGNGEDSPSPFYRQHARLSLFHYQCSKDSTSKEIADVFEKAMQRQEKSDPSKHLSFVFMDEAGLPEEEKESLKVLHYYLEGHMSTRSAIGFVAISNHILDAAKTNRCVMLLRQEPDKDEMLSITRGVMYGSSLNESSVENVEMDGGHHEAREFAERLCLSYSALMRIPWFETFFGLRDFIYLLKAIRYLSDMEMLTMKVSTLSIVRAIERNFNGIGPARFRQIALEFLGNITGQEPTLLIREIASSLRNPMEVIRDALSLTDPCVDLAIRPRYKLIIDRTDDDSIMRLLGSAGVIDLSKNSLFKLSQLAEDGVSERGRLVSGVKYAALHGHLAILSQTEAVNETMYDLFNQRFRSVAGRLYANIAVGGVSRRCLINPGFECVVHVRASKMDSMPAPFLNRFEKYSLGTEDVLNAGLARLGHAATIFRGARERATRLIDAAGGAKALFAWAHEQTLDSVFIDILPKETFSMVSSGAMSNEIQEPQNMEDTILELIRTVSSLEMSHDDIATDVSLARICFPRDLAGAMASMQEGKCDFSDVREKFHFLLRTGKTTSKEIEVLSILLQMVVTRVAMCRLMQTATPEAIYHGSKHLPQELVDNYFAREHFSLRRLIARSTERGDTKRLVVYTRSDATIHSLPCHPNAQRSGPDEAERLQKLRDLVHDRVDELIVENIASLRCESVLRASIESWMKNARQAIYLLVLDMGAPGAVDHANFVRMFVEQRLLNQCGKFFVLLLHHPPSEGHRSRYPALFLNGWNHAYLDAIGQSGPSLDIESLVEHACQQRNNCSVDQRAAVERLSESLIRTLPRVVADAASRKILRPEQVRANSTNSNRADSQSARYDFLMKQVMARSVGDEKVSQILCRKFASIWLESQLLRITNQASDGLLNGRTQLSLSTSIRCNLLDTFNAYILAALTVMNNRRNLDILSGKSINSVNRNVELLFGRILNGLQLPPLEELVLCRQTHETREQQMTARCRFPFFWVIASGLDDLVEVELQDNAFSREEVIVKEIRDHIYNALLVNGTRSPSNAVTEQKRSMLLETIDFVDSSSKQDPVLFLAYVHDYVGRMTCSRSNDHELVAGWFYNRLRSLGLANDILAVHVASKIHEKEFMSMASWASSSALLGVKLQADQSLPKGHHVFARLLRHFEGSLLSDEVNREDWISSFARFLRQVESLLEGERSDCRVLLHRLRVLCFFHILLRNRVSESVETEAVGCWYKDGKLRAEIDQGKHVAISSLLGLGKGADQSLEIGQMAFGFFFSSLWICITDMYWEEDFLCLLDFVSEMTTLDTRSAACILQKACSPCGRTARHATEVIAGIPRKSLRLLGARLKDSCIVDFRLQTGTRSLLHFIPRWLQTSRKEKSASIVSNSNDLNVFFNNYANCFEGAFAEVAFEVILQALLRASETASSEDLLLQFLHDLETGVSQLHSTTDVDMVVVSSMVLDARLLCLIAKVAAEFAREQTSLAFSGTYSDLCQDLFRCLMEGEGQRWDDFFFHTILRVRGEGTMCALLGANGPLNGLGWCKKWIDGAPAMRTGQQEALQQAEKALSDAVQEEEKKSRELRRCPNCNNLFIVAARNCGQFRCGEDAHGGINGVQVQGGHGCGANFSVDTAPNYTADDDILNPLRRRVEDLKGQIQRCDAGALLWEGAKHLEVPMLRFRIDNDTEAGGFVPTAFVTDHREANGTLKDTLSLLQWLRAGTDFGIHQRVLPDLVEFYIWLHSTFRYLVTREQAMELTMGEIMSKDRLLTRFDNDEVHRIMGLWRRTTEALGIFLEENKFTVFWQCGEINVPFKNIEDALLIQFLSEGEHPTDGNDYLFLVINSIIDRYHSFVRRLGAHHADNGRNDESADGCLHPKFIARGSCGAIALHSVVVLPRLELDLLIESCWDSNAKEYDAEKLDTLLRHELIIHVSRPMIRHPIDFLREHFPFRDDSVADAVNGTKSDSISMSQDGYFFANHQDIQLYNDTTQLLRLFEFVDGSVEIRRALEDTFHGCDYDAYRDILEGVRVLFQLMETEGVKGAGSLVDMLCAAFSLSQDNVESQRVFLLGQLGFPELSTEQLRLLLSLKPNEVAEMVRYVGHQLSSEAYLFSRLPLCLKQPMEAKEHNALMAGVTEMKQRDGLQVTIESIDEFINDVLAFYEGQVYRELGNSSQTMRSFLLKNNCCDESDVLFRMLPSDLQLSHYVSLRCHFHQLKLSLMLADSDDTQAIHLDRYAGGGCSIALEPAVGRCWLWDHEDYRNEGRRSNNDKRHFHYKTVEPLWFARQLPEEYGPSERDSVSLLDSADQSDTDPMCVVDNDGPDGAEPEDSADGVRLVSEDRNARILQRWWRRCLLCPKDVQMKEAPTMVIEDRDGGEMMEVDEYQSTSSSSPSKTGWAYSSLYGEQKADVEDKGELYGVASGEAELRRWLDENRLPQTVGDTLVGFGARDIDDVVMICKEYTDLIVAMKPLDRMKLMKAVTAAESSATAEDKEMET